MHWRAFAVFILGIGLIVLLVLNGRSAVIDPLNIQDDAAIPAGALSDAHTIGQTFVAHSSPLSAIQVRWIVSEDFSFAPASRVAFHLRRRVDDSTDLAAISIPLAQIQHNQFSSFDFSPLADSREQTYFFLLDASQAEITRGWFSVWASDDDALPDGQMYFDDRATDHDLAFRAFYAPDLPNAFEAFWKTFVRESSGIPIAAFIFFFPGLALALSFSASREISVETFAFVGGLSLAMLSAASLVLLWFRAPITWLVIVIALLGVSALWFAARKLVCSVVARQSPNREPEMAASRPSTRCAGSRWFLAMSLLALLSLVIGFIQFAELPAPLWVDSYAHASYIKDFLDQGHLPLDYIYHLGYHGIVALLVQWSGTSIPQAMLLVGQLIVTQIGLSFFLLGKRLSGSNVVGLASAIGVWFLTPTPMYFLTWGRYPLLLGAAVLPIALIGAMNLIDPPRFDARTFGVAVITLAGLAFAHIRLLAFYVVFVAIYLVWHNRRACRLGASVGRVTLLAVTGTLIGSIWLATLESPHGVAPYLVARVTVPSNIDLATALAVMLSHYGPIVWALAAVGGIVALVRRIPSALIVIAWFGALLAIAALASVSAIQMLDVAFVVLLGFFPAALCLGELARVLYEKTCQVSGNVSLGWICVGLAISLLGAREMLSIVNPTTILFTRADERAMSWIQANTPNDARFLVNSFAWLPSTYMPADGGSWIPYTTARARVFPGDSIAPDVLAQWIDAQRITHVYLGRRAGVLRARDFADARYELVYSEEGVRIFRVKGHPASTRHLSLSFRSCICPTMRAQCVPRQ